MARQKKIVQPFCKWELVYSSSLQDWVRFIELLPNGECRIGTHAMGERQERVPVADLSRKYVMPAKTSFDRKSAQKFHTICDEVRKELKK